MGYRLKQNCAQGCPQTCGSLPAPTRSCVSRTGSGNLRGWTNFLADVSDWNQVKYTRRDNSGDIAACTYSCPDAPLSSIRQYRRVLAGYALWDVGTDTQDNTNLSGTRYTYNNDVDEFDIPACGAASSHASSPAGITGAPITGCGSTIFHALQDDIAVFKDFDPAYEMAHDMRDGSGLTTKTSKTYQGKGCVSIQFECDGTDVATIQTVGDATVEYSIPDTVHAALVRASASLGSLCRTTAGTIGATSATSVTQVPVTATSVRTTWTQTAITVGQNYKMTITIDRYDASSGGTLLGTTTKDIFFTAGATTEAIDDDNPVASDGYYEETSAVTVAV